MLLLLLLLPTRIRVTIIKVLTVIPVYGDINIKVVGFNYTHSLVFSLEGRSWQEPEPSHVTGMTLAHCILGKFLGVVCHCFPPSLEVPNLAARCLRPQRRERSQQRKVELWARKMSGSNFKFRLPLIFRDLLHAANLRHETDGFTSPPKEGVLRISFRP